jgi:hypothetical protein
MGSGADEWDSLDAETQDRLKEAVCAALLALREPSDSVIRAGGRKSKGIYRTSALQAEAMWKAMVDATLKDQ